MCDSPVSGVWCRTLWIKYWGTKNGKGNPFGNNTGWGKEPTTAHGLFKWTIFSQCRSIKFEIDAQQNGDLPRGPLSWMWHIFYHSNTRINFYIMFWFLTLSKYFLWITPPYGFYFKWFLLIFYMLPSWANRSRFDKEILFMSFFNLKIIAGYCCLRERDLRWCYYVIL